MLAISPVHHSAAHVSQLAGEPASLVAALRCGLAGRVSLGPAPARAADATSRASGPTRPSKLYFHYQAEASGGLDSPAPYRTGCSPGPASGQPGSAPRSPGSAKCQLKLGDLRVRRPSDARLEIAAPRIQRYILYSLRRLISKRCTSGSISLLQAQTLPPPLQPTKIAGPSMLRGCRAKCKPGCVHRG